MPPAPAPAPAPARYGKLEALRGLAAAAMVLFHSLFTVGAESIPPVRHAWLYVDLFFVLSGFVMAHAYGARIREGMGLRTYLSARLARIYPLHLLLLLAWVPYVLAKAWLVRSGVSAEDPTAKSNVATFASALLLVQAWHLHRGLGWNYPSWSISAEWAAYALFFGWARLRRAATPWPPLLAALALYGALAWLSPGSLDVTYDWGVLRCLAGFLLGVAVHAARSRLGPRMPGVAAWELAAVALALAGTSLGSLGLPAAWLSVAGFALAVLAFSDEASGPLGQLLSTRALGQLGAWSYSVYMLHALVIAVSGNVLLRVLHVPSLRGLGAWAVAGNVLLLAAVTALARLSYRWVELPGRAWLMRRLAA